MTSIWELYVGSITCVYINFQFFLYTFTLIACIFTNVGKNVIPLSFWRKEVFLFGDLLLWCESSHIIYICKNVNPHTQNSPLKCQAMCQKKRWKCLKFVLEYPLDNNKEKDGSKKWLKKHIHNLIDTKAKYLLTSLWNYSIMEINLESRYSILLILISSHQLFFCCSRTKKWNHLSFFFC